MLSKPKVFNYRNRGEERTVTKPWVFNYGDYERVVEENESLKERIEELQEINQELKDALLKTNRLVSRLMTERLNEQDNT